MANAGYCSGCGQNVYLNDQGRCPQGHGPESISGVYQVGDAASVAAAPPKKKRTGLVVTIVIVALLLLCGCGAVAAYFLLKPPSKTTAPVSSGTAAKPSAAAEKARVEAASSFLTAMGSGDKELFKSVMPAETVKTVPAESWDALLGDAASDPTVFGTSTWSGSNLTLSWSSSDGSKGTMDFRPASGDLVIATLKPETSESEEATVTLKAEGGRWTVVQFETIDGPMTFDAQGIEDLLQ